MMKRRAEVYDQPITLSQRTDLYELRAPKATSYYEEHVFHDNPEDAKWFHAHLDDVACSAAKGLCDYFGIPYVAPKKETAVQSDTIYRVQVGAFKQKDNADAYLKKVQAAGFPDAYITK
jgi:N-acetylmuramoyl-L-alanine amidase